MLRAGGGIQSTSKEACVYWIAAFADDDTEKVAIPSRIEPG